MTLCLVRFRFLGMKYLGCGLKMLPPGPCVCGAESSSRAGGGLRVDDCSSHTPSICVDCICLVGLQQPEMPVFSPQASSVRLPGLPEAMFWDRYVGLFGPFSMTILIVILFD